MSLGDILEDIGRALIGIFRTAFVLTIFGLLIYYLYWRISLEKRKTEALETIALQSKPMPTPQDTLQLRGLCEDVWNGANKDEDL